MVKILAQLHQLLENKSSPIMFAEYKEQFITEVTDGLLAPLAYFFTDVKMNKMGYDDLDLAIAKNLKPLISSEFSELYKDDVVILDSRSPQDFSKGFIKGSINIGLKGQYAPWVGAILSPESPLLLIADKGFEREAITRLARVGYENVIGFLDGGLLTTAILKSLLII